MSHGTERAGVRVAFVTNFCPHYRVRTFELLAERLDVEFLFFSRGDEWYWPRRYGVRRGDFPHEYLPGFNVAGTRIVLSLPWRLVRRQYDVVIKCINGRFALPASYLSARLRRRPFILWTGVWKRLETPAHRLFHPLTRVIYRRADAVVVYGEHVRRFLVESEGVAAERVFVAPHATDDEPYLRVIPEQERAELAASLGIPQGAMVVLYAGRLEAAKGVDDLLQAFLDLAPRNACLVYVGDGARRGDLQGAVAKAGAGSSVLFSLTVSPDAMPAHYALADVLVLPSRTTATFKEPWGLVVNEAFYQGVPAITTDAVGAAAGGLVEDGVSGLVVPEGDVGALTRALQRMLNDASLRNRLGEGARVRVERWSNERMVEGFIEAVGSTRPRGKAP